MEKQFLTYLLMLIISSCGYSIQSELSNDFDSCAPKDTITPIGHFVKYVRLQDSVPTYELHWGNTNIDRVYDETFTCDYFKSPGKLFFIRDLKDFICITNSCGSRCSLVEFLPINSSSNSFFLHNVHQIFPEKNIVVYINTEDNFDKNTPGDTLLTVMNLKTFKRQNIALSYQYPYSNPMDCIEEIRFENNFLFVKWWASPNNPENPVLRTQMFLLKIL